MKDINDDDYRPGDALAEPLRRAAQEGIEIPELKYPEGFGTLYCTCAFYEAPEDRPAAQCPMHGWERDQQRFPNTDSYDEAQELRRRTGG